MQEDAEPSFALLEFRARRGDAYAFGSLALNFLRTHRGANGEATAEAVALIVAGACMGCQRCSWVLLVYSRIGEPGWEFTPEHMETIEALHERNTERFRARVFVAQMVGSPATVSRLFDPAKTDDGRRAP